MSPEKVKLRRYVLPSIQGEGWCVFVIGSDGYFSGVTDYGNASFIWNAHGCDDFRRFLLRAPESWDYFLRKLFRDVKVYDPDATLVEVKRAILKSRRQGECTAKEAREEWYLLSLHDDLCHEQSFYDWANDCHQPIFADWHARGEYMVKSYDVCKKNFVVKGMARLAEVLKKELEEGIGWEE